MKKHPHRTFDKAVQLRSANWKKLMKYNAKVPKSFLLPCILLTVAIGSISTTTNGDVVYETEDPFGGAFGVLGFDVFEGQSVAVRFTAGMNYSLDSFSVWLWNNDGSGGTPPMTLAIRSDDIRQGFSIPSASVIEEWNFDLPNTGKFNPILFTFDSKSHPLLEAGQNYWITAESPSPPFIDPVWAIAANDSGISSTTDCLGCPWEAANSGAVPTVIVEGTLVTGNDADLNGDGIVNTSDLLILFSSWGPCGNCKLPGDCPADLDNDCVVNTSDLLVLFSNWG